MGTGIVGTPGWSEGRKEGIWSSRRLNFSTGDHSKKPIDSMGATLAATLVASVRQSIPLSLSPKNLAELEAISRERSPEILLSSLLCFGQRLQEQGNSEAAAKVYSTIVQAPLDASLLETQRLARDHLNALTGLNPSPYRSEILLKHFMSTATDESTILAMLAGSGVYRVARASALARLGSNPQSVWWARLLGSHFGAAALGTTLEVPVFCLTGRGIASLSGRENPWNGAHMGSDLLAAGLTLSSLKIFSALSREGIQLAARLGASLRSLRMAEFALPQAAVFSGLRLASRLEESVGLRPIEGPSVGETLASMISLGVGSHLAYRILGPGFARYAREIELRRIFSSSGKLSVVPTVTPSTAPASWGGLKKSSGSEGLSLHQMAMAGNRDSFSSPPQPEGHVSEPRGSLEESLHLLYAHYAGDPQAQEEILRTWPALRTRIESGSLSLDDWNTIHSMFQVLAVNKEKIFNKWFLQLSRRFGTADHGIRSTSGTLSPEGKDEPFADLGPVDSLRLGALLEGYALAQRFTPVAPGIRRYLGLAPEFRTHFMEQMLVVDQVIQSILTLNPEAMTPEMQNRLKDTSIRNLLELTFIDLKDLLFEHETRPSLINNTITNILYGSHQAINLYRVHINMTTINEKDGTNLHGNVYLETVRGWFQEKFGRIHVIQNPERTTFEFIAPSTRQVRESMSDFATEIKTRIATTYGVNSEIVGHFLPKAVISGRKIHRGNLYDYAVRSSADAEAFRPVLEFGGKLKVDELKTLSWPQARRILHRARPDFEGIRVSGNPVLVKTLNALIIKATLELNADLAAQTNFFEKEHAALPKRRNGDGKENYQSVFTETDLPRPGTALHNMWKTYRHKKSGYVGSGQYDPGYHNPELKGSHFGESPFFDVGTDKNEAMRYEDDPRLSPVVNHLLRIIPRLGHIKGLISHEREGSEGGLLQQFKAKMLRTAEAGPREIPERLADWQTTAKKLWGALLHFYSLAVTDPRNAWTPKQHRHFLIHRGTVLVPVASNFFIQEVALSGNTFLAALEYDSFKAFNDQHARQDEIDADYNRVRDAIFLAARQMKMPMPLINPSGGDHISLSFSERDLDGHPIDGVKFCALVQKLVRAGFANRPFQDLNKVEMREINLKVEDPELLAGGEFLERMRQTMELNTSPQFHPGSNGDGTLYMPLKNASNYELSVRVFLNYLQNQGVKASVLSESRQIHRLPIWKKIEGREDKLRDFWVFARQAPPGYEPFHKSLTVSMALGKHPALQEPTAIPALMELEDWLGIRLGMVKENKWPHKEGFGLVVYKPNLQT